RAARRWTVPRWIARPDRGAPAAPRRGSQPPPPRARARAARRAARTRGGAWAPVYARKEPGRERPERSRNPCLHASLAPFAEGDTALGGHRFPRSRGKRARTWVGRPSGGGAG